jgi:hypothetical protein
MELQLDITRERDFERRLIKSGELHMADAIWQTQDWSACPPAFLLLFTHVLAIVTPVGDRLAVIQESYVRDERRALYVFPKPIVEQVLEARRSRIERKTAEAQKLATGEWVTRWKRLRVSRMRRAGVPKRLLARREVTVNVGRIRGNGRTKTVRQRFTNSVHPHRDILHAPLYKRVFVNPRAGAPPAHILEGMSEKERREDQILRSRTGGGYVAHLRRMRGWKQGVKGRQGLEDDRPRKEDAELKKIERQMARENVRRRSLAEKKDKARGIPTDN